LPGLKAPDACFDLFYGFGHLLHALEQFLDRPVLLGLLPGFRRQGVPFAFQIRDLRFCQEITGKLTEKGLRDRVG
jgi:hypothetical protein